MFPTAEDDLFTATKRGYSHRYVFFWSICGHGTTVFFVQGLLNDMWFKPRSAPILLHTFFKGSEVKRDLFHFLDAEVSRNMIRLQEQKLKGAFSFRAPFDVSLCVLAVMSVIIVFTWPENYGDPSVGNTQSYKNAIHAIMSGRAPTHFTTPEYDAWLLEPEP